MTWCDDDYDFRSYKRYTQVRLTKDNMTQVTWIPMHLAVHNKVLKLQVEGNVWDDGWVVTEIWKEAYEYEVDAIMDQARSLRSVNNRRKLAHEMVYYR